MKSENVIDNDFIFCYHTKTKSGNILYIFRFKEADDDTLYAVAISSNYYSIYKVENTFKDLLSNKEIYTNFIKLSENEFIYDIKSLFNEIDEQLYQLYEIEYYIR